MHYLIIPALAAGAGFWFGNKTESAAKYAALGGGAYLAYKIYGSKAI